MYEFVLRNHSYCSVLTNLSFISALGTPANDLVAVVGFQVDQIVDAVEGEAIIKITGYNALDGQASDFRL